VIRSRDLGVGEEELTTFYGVVGRPVSRWHLDMLNAEVKLRLGVWSTFVELLRSGWRQEELKAYRMARIILGMHTVQWAYQVNVSYNVARSGFDSGIPKRRQAFQRRVKCFQAFLESPKCETRLLFWSRCPEGVLPARLISWAWHRSLPPAGHTRKISAFNLDNQQAGEGHIN
jgi:hypothetical protein